MDFEPLRFPHLKLLAKTDKGDVAVDAGVLAQALRQDGAAVLVEGEDVTGAVKRSREMIVFIGIGSEITHQALDLVDQALAAGVERGSIERGVAVDPLKTVFGENRAEGGGHRNPAFGVNPIGE